MHLNGMGEREEGRTEEQAPEKVHCTTDCGLAWISANDNEVNN